MTHLLDPLPITPFTYPARGAVTLPGSKSITNRALLLAALCDTPVTLANALFSEDTEIMAKALNALGIKVTSDAAARTMQVTGQGGKIPADSAELFVGNAGTAARFLTALCAAAPRGVFKLDGLPQIRKRPMKGLVDALRAQGAEIHCLNDETYFPMETHARGLRGGQVAIDAGESSQILSALLMVAPLAQKQLVVTLANTTVSKPFVGMTLRMMEHFGQNPTIILDKTNTFLLPHFPYARKGPYKIEVDATAASYFAALPIVAGGELEIKDVWFNDGSLQGDIGFIKLLAHHHHLLTGIAWGHPPGPLRCGTDRTGITHDFNAFSDTFLTLAAIAPLLAGPTRITGIAHTRKQETDRVAGAARELRRLGQEVVEEEDALTISPRPLIPDVEIETYNDHRFAMSFAILGCHDLRKNGQPWLRLRNPGCCAKTFPYFFEVLEQVRQNSLSHS